MTAEIIPMPPRPVNHGNGAREALERLIGKDDPSAGALSRVDALLIGLWLEGFKIIPLGPGE